MDGDPQAQVGYNLARDSRTESGGACREEEPKAQLEHARSNGHDGESSTYSIQPSPRCASKSTRLPVLLNSIRGPKPRREEHMGGVPLLFNQKKKKKVKSGLDTTYLITRF